MKKVWLTVLFLQFFSYFCFCQIPDLYINTKASQPVVSKTEWIEGSITIKNSVFAADTAKKSEGDFSELPLTIKGRGNSTWTNVSKKPYTIKLKEKKSLLGMSASKHWVLLANYFDNSFIKNDLAFYIARTLEMKYVPEGKFVNLYLNDRYKGLYYLCEQIKVEKNRVAIQSDTDFLLEADDLFDEQWKFHSEQHLPYQIKNDDKMTEDRLEFIEAKVNQLEEKLYSPDFPYKDKEHKILDLSYKRYIDTESFLKFYLVQEIMDNYDPNHPRSCFMTYETEKGIFTMGPVWDFDWTLINKNAGFWQCKNSLYYSRLLKSPDFVKALKKIWKNYYPELEKAVEYAEKTSAEIKEQALRDRAKWPVSEKNSWSPGFIDLGGYDEEAAFVKNTLKARLQWMNREIQKM